jgi:hypothetical protein
VSICFTEKDAGDNLTSAFDMPMNTSSVTEASTHTCIRQAYVSIRQHTSAYVSIRQQTSATSAYVSRRQQTSADVSRRQRTLAYVDAHHISVGERREHGGQLLCYCGFGFNQIVGCCAEKRGTIQLDFIKDTGAPTFNKLTSQVYRVNCLLGTSGNKHLAGSHLCDSSRS